MAIERNPFNGHSQKTMTKDLTELEILFCHKYISCNGNITQACKETGIARPTGYAYLKKEGVKQYLEILSSTGVDGGQVATTEQIIQVLSDIITGKRNDEILNMKSGEVMGIKPNAMAVTGAIKLLLQFRGELNPVQLNQFNLYTIPDSKDLTKLIETKKVTEVPIDVEYMVLDAEEEEGEGTDG